MDDDSFYCPYCGQKYGSEWTMYPEPDRFELSPQELLEMERGE